MIIKDTDVVEEPTPGLVSITDLDGHTTYVLKAALLIEEMQFQASQRKLW